MSNKFSETDIIPKKLAIKFDPPIIALEYYLAPLNTDYLLQINLEECIKQYDDPNEICDWVFKTYGDIVNKQTIPEKQVLNLVQRILLMRRMGNGKKKSVGSNNVSNQEIFEPDPYRKEDEEEFYKSNHNFYKNDGIENGSRDNPHDDIQDVEEIVNHDQNEGDTGNTNTSKSGVNAALEERNKNYSDEFIKKEIEGVNRVNRYVMNNEEVSSARMNEGEFKADNLNEYFKNKENQNQNEKENNTIESNNYNYMDEISVESLHSDTDEKF